MQGLLLGTQIGAILTYIGGAFFLYHLLSRVYEARLAGAQEENARLCRQIEELEAKVATPGKVLQSIALIEKESELRQRALQLKVGELEGALAVAKESGDRALQAETEKRLTIERQRAEEGEMIRTRLAALTQSVIQLKAHVTQFEAMQARARKGPAGAAPSQLPSPSLEAALRAAVKPPLSPELEKALTQIVNQQPSPEMAKIIDALASQPPIPPELARALEGISSQPASSPTLDLLAQLLGYHPTPEEKPKDEKPAPGGG